METLEQKIELLKADDSWKKQVKNDFPKIEHLAFMSYLDKKRAIFTCKTLQEASEVLNKYLATETEHKIDVSGKTGFKTINSPYRIDITNPAKTSEYSPYKFSISYMSDNIDVEIDLPIDYIDEYTLLTTRGITESEYHWFVGVSYEKLRNMRLHAYQFTKQEISWYGGNKTLIDSEITNEIINKIKLSV